MNRRSILAFLITLLMPWRLWAGDVPVQKASWGTVPLSKPEWPRVVQMVQQCVISAGHWTIGALSAAAANIGQVRHHLVSVHGHSYGELSGMSKEQLLNVHDADHEGRHTRRAASSASSCPGGVCPTSRTRQSKGGNGNITTKTRTNIFTGLNFF